MNIFSDRTRTFLITSNTLALLLVVFTIFIIPFFPLEWHRIIYSLSFTFISLLTAFALSKYRSNIFIIAIFVIIIEWSSVYFMLPVITAISFLINVIFFILIVILFIWQIILAKTISFTIILESIIGYLLIGMAMSILVGLVSAIDPGSFNFKQLSESVNSSTSHFSSYIYYGFVTLTTLGYGDVIPLTPAARSLSIFISVSGQMYIAIIIALIVSKYLSQRSE